MTKVSDLEQTLRRSHLKLDEIARFVEPHNLHWKADESTWSVAQILAHVAEFEHFFTQDVLNLRENPGAKFGRTMEHEKRLEAVRLTGAETLDPLLLGIEQSKQETLAMLASLSEEQLQIEGTNPKFGTRTIEWEVEHFITEHVQKHIEQIERVYAIARNRGEN